MSEGFAVGDMVALRCRGTLTSIRAIERITATQIVVDMWRFRRRDLMEVGANSSMSIARVTQEDRDTIESAEHCRWLRNVSWGGLPVEALRQIVAVVKAAMAETSR